MSRSLAHRTSPGYTGAAHALPAVYQGVYDPTSRHADVLKTANLAQIVNVIAPIMTPRRPWIRIGSTCSW